MKTGAKIHTNLTKTTFLLKFIFYEILYLVLSFKKGVQAVKTEKARQINQLTMMDLIANFKVYLTVINLKAF